MSDQSRAAVLSSQTNDPRVRAALFEYFERIDRGETVDPAAFLASHADVALELRSLIAVDGAARRLRGGASPQEDLSLAQTIPPKTPMAEVSTHSVAGKLVETSAIKPPSPAEAVNPDQTPLVSMARHTVAAPPPKPPLSKSANDLPDLFGRYQVKQKLGQGAMGAVYFAVDSLLQRKVALKTPTFDDDTDGELLRRFHREARAVANLKHPNLCAVYDVGEIDGRHYISMEFVAGKKLTDFIKPDKPMTEKQAMAVVRKIALAMHEAHTHGVIHRDLKPDNIMVNEKGEPVVMDFGLVHKVDAQDSTKITQHGTLIGSPAYMSKEQVEGDPDKLTGATDQYSLGVVLYQLLTSKLPFEGGLHAVLGAILVKEPSPPSQHRPDLNPHLEAVCLKMMAKEASARYPSMKAAADALAAVARGTSTMAGASLVARPKGNSASEALLETTLEPTASREGADEFDFNAPYEPPRRRKPSRRGPSRPLNLKLIGGLAAAFVLLAAVIVVTIGDSKVTVQIDAPGFDVSFNEAEITIKDGERERRVKPGDHTLHIKSSKLGDDGAAEEFDTEKLTLKKGGKPAVTVTREDSETVVKLDGVPVPRKAFTKSSTGEPPIVPGEKPFDATPTLVQSPKTVFENSQLVASEKLLDDFQTQIDRVSTRKDIPDGEKATLKKTLEAERQTYEKFRTIPFSPTMRAAAIAYLERIQTAKKLAQLDYERLIDSEMKKPAGSNHSAAIHKLESERDDTARRMLVGYWRHREGQKVLSVLSLYSDSTFERMPSYLPGEWSLNNTHLVLKSSTSGAPGNVWVDTYTTSNDGQSFSGRNQVGLTFHGDRIDPANAALAITTRSPTASKPTPETKPGVWIKLLDTKFEPSDPARVKLTDGVLELDSATVKFPEIRAKDIVFRAKVKRIDQEKHLTLSVRDSAQGGYIGYHSYNAVGKWVGIAKWQGQWRDIQFVNSNIGSDFTEMSMEARGDQLRVSVGDKPIVTVTDGSLKEGSVSISAHLGRAQFKDLEVMILDGVAAAPATPSLPSATPTTQKAPTSPAAPVSPAKHVRTLGAGYCMDARVTADGKHIATVDLGGLIKWWNADSGELIRTIGKHGSRADELALAAKGQLAASGGFDRGEVKLWDVNKETDSLFTLPGTGKWGVDLEGTCDGRHLIVRANGAVRIYRITVTPLATGTTKTPANNGLPKEIADKLLVGRATTSFGEIEVHALGEVKSSGPIATSTTNPHWIYFGLPNDGKTIRLWDIEKSEEVCQFTGPTKTPHNMSLSADGKRLVAFGGIPSSFVWDAATGKLIATVNGDSAASLSPNGDRVLIHQWASPIVEEWELNGPSKLRQFNAKRGDFVHHVNYVNASRVVLATAAGAEIYDVPPPPAAKPTAEKLAEWAKSRYQIPVTRTLAGHAKLPLKLVYSKDGSRLLSCSEDGTLRYWDTASAESLVTLNGHKGAVTCCALSADGKQALSGGLDDIVRWWDLEAGSQLAEFKGHGAAIYAVAFDAGSNEAVSVSANNTICRWNLAEKIEASRFTASHIRGYGGHKDVVNLLGASFTPDARQVLVPGYFGTIHLIDTKGQTEAGKFGAWGFRDMTFSDDGSLMACTSEHSLSVWDVATRTQKVELQGKNGGQRGVTFTRDGKRLIVGANNQPTRVWDIESKAVIGELSNKSNGWSAIATSPDDQWAASGGDNGKILLWPLSWITE